MSSSSDLPGLEERTIEEVRTSTRFLLNSFKAKTDELKRSAGKDVEALMRFGVDEPTACSTAEEFFGEKSVGYIAIDGTFAIDQKLDLLVFYVGAFGYSGTLAFEDGRLEVGDPLPMSASTEAVSASIPLSEEDAATVFGQRTESGTELETQRLPSAIMHLAEYYIAIKSIDADPRLKVVLLDRPLAGDVSHLVWSSRDLVNDGLSILEGMETRWGKVTRLDLDLARLMVVNAELKIPAPRSQLLKFAALAALFEGAPLSVKEMLERLGADEDHASVLMKDLFELDSKHHLFEEERRATLDEPKFKLKPGVKDYWSRVLSAALAVSDHVFSPKSEHPLRLRERWVTAEDLDYIVLVFVLELTRRAWSDRLLPIGLTKDSAASELVRAVIPLLRNSKLQAFSRALPNFNSDKMLLQTDSVVNGAKIPTPWHTVDFDSAFRTMVPIPDEALPEGEARATGAYRNVIPPERMFVKAYIQLWSSKNDPSVRSHVFTFDRPAFAGYDHWGEMVVHNRDNELDEKISPVLNFHEGSAMTNLAMSILFSMSGEVVPEALGHNFPLFLADKKAKFVLRQSKNAYLGAVDVEMAKSELDQQVLFSQRFRDYRTQVERSRKGN